MDEQQLKLAFIQYLQQKSGARTQQEFEAYVLQLGEEGLQQEYAQFIQLLQQQQVQSAKLGAKLNYIQKLRGVCPEGYEMQFFRQGGQICKKCVLKAKMADGGKTPMNPIDDFRLRRQTDKIKRKPKNMIGEPVHNSKFDPNTTLIPPRGSDGMLTPNKLQRVGEYPNNILTPKKPIKMDKCGSKMNKKINKNKNGNPVTLKKETSTKNLDGEKRTRQWSDGTKSRMETSEGGNTYIGRRGEIGVTNVPNVRQNAVADSLRRADWSSKTAPVLKKRTD